MQTNLYPQQWLPLSKEVKDVLIKEFSIGRSGVTEVRDQSVVSDGYTTEDLRAITQEKMNKYIGSEENFMRGWEITLAKVHAVLNPPVAEIKESTIIDVIAPFCIECKAVLAPHFKKCPNFVKENV